MQASSDPRSPRCHALLHDLLFEVELGGHKASRRLPFLSPSVLPALLERLGLTVVRHLSRCVGGVLAGVRSAAAVSQPLYAACTAGMLRSDRSLAPEQVRGWVLLLGELTVPTAAASHTHTHSYTHRLLPLLLEWLHSYDAPSRAAASRGLCHLITRTWPRMPRHAPLLWQHLVVLVAKETAAAAEGDASTVSAAVASGQMRAEAEAAGVEVVSDALAAAEARLMQGPAVTGSLGNTASASTPAA
eukprot:scaffold97593_cov21-Tisochrysis_lutea.AAC.2